MYPKYELIIINAVSSFLQQFIIEKIETPILMEIISTIKRKYFPISLLEFIKIKMR